MKKKIIFCIPELVIGGVDIALCELLYALKQLNTYEISVITKKYSPQQRFDSFFRDNNIILYNMSLRWKFCKIIERALIKFKIKNILKSNDIIIDFSYCSFLKYHKNLKRPKITWLHCSFPNFKNKVFIKDLDFYNKIICVSKTLASDIKKTYPHLKDKLSSVYNPLNLDKIIKGSSEIIFTVNKPYFVSVQRIDKSEKDIETVIKAFNLFVKKYSNFYLYIVGDGDKEYKSYLQNICESNNIIFTGQLQNSYAIIKDAQALILSSTKEVGEGMPVVLQEAQALHTLAISSDVPSGPHEILLGGSAGLLFEPGNYNQLEKILEDTVAKKDLCQNLINCGIMNLNRFNPSLVAQDFVKIIEDL